MYKVLVVDDEPAIRQGLLKIVDWEALGFCVVGDVSNGRKAVALHKELSPELIVIDIRMPGMDGLQAIREIRKTDGDCQFLILSGYADFAYAKQAIEMNVSGYVLQADRCRGAKGGTAAHPSQTGSVVRSRKIIRIPCRRAAGGTYSQVDRS